MGLNVHQRIAAVMKDCTYVQKDRNKVAGQYTAVKHDDVTAKIRPYLLANGLIITSTVTECQITEGVITRKGRGGESYDTRNVVANVTVCQEVINIENPSDRVMIHSNGMGEDQGDKAIGKAISYACKYGILKTFLLETGDDADNDASIETVIQRSLPAVSEDDSRLVWDAYHAAAKVDKKSAWKALVTALGYTPGADREPVRMVRETAVDDALTGLKAVTESEEGTA